MSEKLSRRKFLEQMITGGAVLGFSACSKVASFEKWEKCLKDIANPNFVDNIEDSLKQEWKEWFKEFQQFKESLEKQRIKEKLFWLKQKYKQNLYFFEIATDINTAIIRSEIITDEIQRLVQNESSWDQEDKQTSVEHINQEGIQLLKEVKNHWCFSFTERKQELLKTKTQFKNFERSNIDLPKLSETLSATHPQDIIDSHIAEITWFDWQQSQKIKFQKWKDLEFPNYSAEDLNLIKGLLNRPAGKIRLTELENFAWRKKGVHIYSTEKFLLKPQKALQDTISLINHEIFGHATDWAHSTLLNSFQRIDYLYRIAQRLEKGNNLYSSPQVEQRFKKINNYTRAEEYNAYICQVYYDTPEKLRKEHPEDFELVDNTVRILDPSFDVFGKTKK